MLSPLNLQLPIRAKQGENVRCRRPNFPKTSDGLGAPALSPQERTAILYASRRSSI